MTAQVDMLRKLSIVAVGTLFDTKVSQVFAVLSLASLWLCVQCRVMPYRFREDNVLKMACDLAIVVICACELAYISWDMNQVQAVDEPCDTVAFSPYERRFVGVVGAVVLLCILVVFVKLCRLQAQMDSTWTTGGLARAVLELVDGGGQAAAAVDLTPQGLDQECRAMRKYRAVGVVSDREQALLRTYFERVRVSEAQREQMFKLDGVPWVFVSSPEYLFTGEAVMEFIEAICSERPWQFKQARACPPESVCVSAGRTHDDSSTSRTSR